MLQPDRPRMTFDEYLAWRDAVEGRHELVDGVPVAMAAERALHVRTEAAVFDALRRLRLDAPFADAAGDG